MANKTEIVCEYVKTMVSIASNVVISQTINTIIEEVKLNKINYLKKLKKVSIRIEDNNNHKCDSMKKPLVITFIILSLNYL